MSTPPLVVHVIHHLVYGGLENGVVNLINRIPADRYRHAVICVADYNEFRERIQRADCAVYAMHKQPGKDPGTYLRMWRLLRQLRPAIVHSRNISGLIALPPAWLAGVPGRVHGEHGWDIGDVSGSNPKRARLRRLHRPLVHRYVALSAEIKRYLIERIGAAPGQVAHICNGVDTERFHPAADERPPLPWGAVGADSIVLGTVGRLQPVKDQVGLVRAFVLLRQQLPELASRLRLAILGDGPQRGEIERAVSDAGVGDFVWLPGMCDQVPALLRRFDVFVLPSLTEGISNTILEALACGVPVVATAVGGNPDLIIDGGYGALVPPADPQRLAAALVPLVSSTDLRRRYAERARTAA